MSKPITDEQLTAEEREIIHGKPWPQWVGQAIGAIAFLAFASPFIASQVARLGHDVPEGYQYLVKNNKGDFVYTRSGNKYEDVQMLDVHIIKADNRVETITAPVDCGAREIYGKTPKYKTVGAKMLAKACR